MRESQRLRDAFNYLFQEELDYLYEITATLPPNPEIINIGSGAGTSGLAFLEARPDSHVSTIDITAESSPFGCLIAEELSAFVAGVHDRLTQYHGESIEIGKAWDKGLVDLVFVDGDHTYEGCIGDMQVFGDLLKPGGWLLVHDYNKDMVYTRLGNRYSPKLYPHPKSYDGVDKAVMEWVDGQVMEFVECVETIAVFRK